MNVKKLITTTIVSILLLSPVSLFADLGTNNVRDYFDSKYGFTVTIPKYWSDFEAEYSALKGGQIRDVYITQQSDIASRRTKFFSMQAGAPSSIFGLSNKVVQQVSKEEMVDFYISQLFNGVIGYNILKTYTKGTGDKKIYVIEGSYLEYGPYKVMRSDYFQFKGDKAYHWAYAYFETNASYAPTLQAISDSVIIK